MKKAPTAKNEKQRLQELYQALILDTGEEKKFDDIAKLASFICGVPIALVSFVDSDRQWFKSKIGLEAKETPRDIAFCSHAILDQEVFEVEDATKDERFSDNPLVINGPRIKFYAGAPLVSNGQSLGTLCVIDTKPNKLSLEQKQALQILASQVMDLIELRKKNTQLKSAQEKLNTANESVRVRQQQFLTYARKHYSVELANGVIEQIVGPLDSIKTNAFKLLSEYGSKSDQPKGILTSASEIDAILARLEKLTSFEDSGDREHFKLASCVNSLLLMSKRLTDRYKIQIAMDIDPEHYVYASRFQISQVLLNLFRNSVESLTKVTNRDRIISFQVTDADINYELEFMDNGDGIPAEHVDTIFQPFTGDVSNDRPGLGLYISKGIMFQNGGDIFLKSAAHPTSFIVRIPKGSKRV